MIESCVGEDFYYVDKINCERKRKKYIRKNQYYFIYKITCLKTDRSYIGRTICPSMRMSRHLQSLKSGKHKIAIMQKDFDDYGEENFETEILLKTDFDNRKIEKMFQECFQTNKEEFGYNYKDSYWSRRK